jgi:hypothetical protein
MRDANLLPNPNKFVEEFARYTIISLLNFFLGYN